MQAIRNGEISTYDLPGIIYTYMAWDRPGLWNLLGPCPGIFFGSMQVGGPFVLAVRVFVGALPSMFASSRRFWSH